MKRAGLLHAELARQVALLGHTDTFVIGDSGLPLPRGVPVIDLALSPGTVSWRDALDALLAEVVVAGHTVAQECAQTPVAGWLDERADLLGAREVIPHEDLKARLPGVAFAVRTGERTPYANTILTCGVPF